MAFEDFQISGVNDLLDFLKGQRGRSMIFRGQSKADWHLEPSIFRPTIVTAKNTADRVRKEMAMLRSFKKKTRFRIADRPSYKDSWQWLALARHYDLPTRLLDWSESAGVALYFAVRKKQNDIDSVLWCSEKPDTVNTGKDDPFLIRNILLYEPEHIAARIAVQKSVFTVHPEDYKDKYLEWPCSLIKATIKASAREPIRKMLDDLGIDNVMLCPEPHAIAGALREKYGLV